MNVREYLLLVARQRGAALSGPKVGSSGSPEVGDGNTNIKAGTSSTGTEIGRVWCSMAGSPPTLSEAWYFFDLNAWLSGVSTLVKGTGDTTIPAADLALFQADPDAKKASFSFQYAAVPPQAQIDQLPDVNPAGVSGSYFKLQAIPAGAQAGVVDGQLYREACQLGGGVVEHVEHWMLFHGYFEPAGNDVVRVSPDGASPPTTLKAYLNAMRTLWLAQTPTNQGLWRYAQVRFRFGPVS